MHCEVTDLSQPLSVPTHPLCYDVYAVITVLTSMFSYCYYFYEVDKA